jgi:hypothetical protein
MVGKRNQFNIRKLKIENETKTGEDVKTIDIVDIFPAFNPVLL